MSLSATLKAYELKADAVTKLGAIYVANQDPGNGDAFIVDVERVADFCCVSPTRDNGMFVLRELVLADFIRDVAWECPLTAVVTPKNPWVVA